MPHAIKDGIGVPCLSAFADLQAIPSRRQLAAQTDHSHKHVCRDGAAAAISREPPPKKGDIKVRVLAGIRSKSLPTARDFPPG